MAVHTGYHWRNPGSLGAPLEFRVVHRLSDGDPTMRPEFHGSAGHPEEDNLALGCLGIVQTIDDGGGKFVRLQSVTVCLPARIIRVTVVKNL